MRRTVLVIPQGKHELMACLRKLLESETFPLSALRKPIIGDGRGYNMESWKSFPALCEERHDFAGFKKTARLSNGQETSVELRPSPWGGKTPFSAT